MTGAAERFVLITEHAEKDADHWIVSAAAETLALVRRLVYPCASPDRLSRSEFDGERIEPIVVFPPAAGRRRPAAASVWRLSPRSVPAAEHGGEHAIRFGASELTDYQRSALMREGVAESDASSYARLQMLGYFGSQHLERQSFEEAEKVFLEALELAHQLDHPRSIVKTRGSLGMARTGLGRFDEAIEDLRAALAVARRNGFADEERPTAAALEEALARRRDSPDDASAAPAAAMMLAIDFAEQGIRACLDGAPASGRDALEKAAAIFSRLESGVNLVQILGHLGRAQQGQGDVKAAMKTYLDHLQLCVDLDDFRTSGSSFLAVSDILLSLGQKENVRPLLELGLSKIEDEDVRRNLFERRKRLDR